MASRPSWRSVHITTLRTPSARAARRSSRSATGHRPKVGCRAVPRLGSGVAAKTSGCAIPSAANCRQGTRSQGKNGVSAAAVTMHSAPWSAAQSSPANTPANGPANPSTLSAITGKSNPSNRAGSPLAFSAKPATCGPSRSTTCPSNVVPPRGSNPLSPPPIRVACPPAKITPTGCFMPPPCARICAAHPPRRPGPHHGPNGPLRSDKQNAAPAYGQSRSGPPAAQSQRPRR
mmetsp:Transcript_28773/g.54605  ORF Transcript_28773/g.54605 Transcript_28773/m.54605 type:complete len:232 (+) Transcript_28773:1745-2440(+)